MKIQREKKIYMRDEYWKNGIMKQLMFIEWFKCLIFFLLLKKICSNFLIKFFLIKKLKIIIWPLIFNAGYFYSWIVVVLTS